ncbi:hypothetical protein ISF_03985 [Cordyceps fumosorosea ARSEF 2679]|uniref:Uncharacterized protein n=1 Tax=Cordyceps fumosorosea (strain ARSEF 2679) TaxID=1081104 RepID=A0A167YC83_CORFA|nr:hypothetical protein ISF_03985 [Cordyceps fumosorosea ARSEF 2679]OAA66147.1 hypothetical protein ISF_03985 [Cordyceps fumosorosea ARSEF 2679]
MGYLGCRTGLLTNLGTSEVSADVLSSVKEMSLLPDSVYCIEFQIKGSPRGAFVVIVSLTRHSTLLASIQRREDVNLEMGVRDTMIENVPGITEQEIVGGTIRIQTRPLQNSALPERTPVPLDYLNYVLEVAVVRKGSRGNNAEPSNAKKRKYSSDQ